MAQAKAQFDFTGARVLVTGGTSGIGAAIAAAYAAAGAHVTITGTRDALSDYADLSSELSGDFDYLRMDLEDAASIEAVAAALPALDVLVNNAGLSFYVLGLDEHDPDVFMRALTVHLGGAFRLSMRLADKLAQSRLAGGGSIIGIASTTSYMANSVTLGYGTAKTGLLGMTRGLAVDLGPRNIRVNAVAAGLTESRMTAGAFANPVWSEPTLARTPLGRLGQPVDIAGAVLFLSSAQAAWITGQTLPVDGGYTISG